MTFECTLTGRPITKKNHMQLVRAGGRTVPIQSKAYKAYEAECLCQLLMATRLFTPYPKNARLNLRAIYYMPDRRSRPDLVGLIQATQDILQKARIVEDDVSFVSLDGSRIAGIDRDNPRVEIEIEEVQP